MIRFYEIHFIDGSIKTLKGESPEGALIDADYGPEVLELIEWWKCYAVTKVDPFEKDEDFPK